MESNRDARGTAALVAAACGKGGGGGDLRLVALICGARRSSLGGPAESRARWEFPPSATLRAINPTTWIDSTDYRELEFRSSLKTFTSQRARLLTVLEALPFGRWSRSATVVGAGKPLERTVITYADWLARHERTHWKQIEKTVEAVRNCGG